MARTILLTAGQSDNRVWIHWNPYRDWPKGVSKYQVERRTPGQMGWQFIGSTTDTFFTDMDAYYLYKDPFAYRVKAVENDIKPDTSQSNHCVVVPGPSIFAPSAFTPGNDHINETFTLVGWALDPDSVQPGAFMLEVFNRWGQRVFSSHDLHIGWNGTCNNQPCPADQYVWTAQVKALNGTTYFLKGGVLLLR
jgi:gliding motility-associated-like protein